MDLITLALSRKYTDETIKGAGAIKGEQGDPGITPHIDTTTKHWIIGTTDTGIVAEGKVPTIDPITFHWIIDGQDTGISAKPEELVYATEADIDNLF